MMKKIGYGDADRGGPSLSKIDNSITIVSSQFLRCGVAIVLLSLFVVSCNPLCTRYGVCNEYQYVPAPPGHTPHCAKPGSTFCEKVDQYPRELIRYLIEKWGYDFGTLFSDESRDDFNERKSLTPAAPFYGPEPLIQRAISYGPINITNPYTEGGYPDRRYKIEPYFLTNALQQPPDFNAEPQFYYNRDEIGYSRRIHHSTPHTLHVWNRYKRSRDERKRRKRQTSPISSANLCPTRANYIMPEAALNTRGNWMYTVNLNEVDSRYTQLVRSETCLSNRCNGLCTLPNGYSSRCQQQYVQKRLVALEGNGNRLYSDVFWFPHCCVCQITSN